MTATAMLAPPAQAAYDGADRLILESKVFLASMEFGRVASVGLSGVERAKYAARAAQVTWDHLVLNMTLVQAAEQAGLSKRRVQDARRLADDAVKAAIRDNGELPGTSLPDVVAYMRAAAGER